jgi:DNA-binding LacI/PurR family transcriptional regulator
VFSPAYAVHRRVDAIIFVDVPVSSEELAALAEQSLALVSVGHELPQITSVGIDDVEVGRIAARHLIELGHRRIGLINGSEELPFVVPHQRQNGFEEAMRAAGLEPDPTLYVPGNFTAQDGADALHVLMEHVDPPTAIFALADEMAFGVILAADERGVKIPDDVSLIGVDDHDFAPIVGLTTVHQDVAEHGARAARLVVTQLGHSHELVDTAPAPIRLVVRRTTASPPSG